MPVPSPAELDALRERESMPARSHPHRKSRTANKKEFRFKVEEQLRILVEASEGEQLDGSLVETPDRVARMWCEEFTSGYDVDIAALFRTFDAEEYGGMVAVQDIPVCSTCEHHMLPIIGFAHIGYVPDGKVIGLSKLPRLVNAYSRRLQIQERLTHQISEAIEEHLAPRGSIVVISAEHTCTTLRGIQAPGTLTKTCEVNGVFRDPAESARQEFLELLMTNHGSSR